MTTAQHQYSVASDTHVLEINRFAAANKALEELLAHVMLAFTFA